MANRSLPAHSPLSEALLGALESEHTLLTPNRRLARTIHLAWADHCRGSGRTAWPTPTVMSVHAWLRRAWQEYTDSPAADAADRELLLLSQCQEEAAWELVIVNSQSGNRPLLSQAGSAREAMRAFQVLHDYAIPESHLSKGTPEADAFRQWIEHFTEMANRKSWLAPTQLPSRLLEAFTTNRWRPASPIHLVGFDTLLPSMKRLFTALHESGCAVQQDPVTSRMESDKRCTRYAAADPQEETAAAARWARHLLMSNPTLSIGVVFPDLEERLSAIEHVFLSVLHPNALSDPLAAPERRAFNISASPPLSTHPVGRAALLILRLCVGRLPAEEAGTLLRSPHIGINNSVETAARALWDAELRCAGMLSVTRADLLAVWDHGRQCRKLPKPALYHSLAGLGDLLSPMSEKAQPSKWAADMFAVLRQADFLHASQGAHSSVYQAFEAFRDAVELFLSLGEVRDTLTFAESVSALAQICSSETFQPGNTEAQINVLGLLEASGQTFDYLWIAGLDDETWPPAPAPSPYIPTAVQVRQGVHRASSDLCMEYARRLTNRLLASAPVVVVSSARIHGDAVRRPSPLIANCPIASPPVASDPSPARLLQANAAEAMETVGDSPPPAPFPDGELRHGTYHLREHSICPFRAFARHRLGAEQLETPHAGFSALERGSALHNVLAALWREIRTSTQLKALVGTAALDKKCRTAVTRVVRSLQEERPSPVEARIAGIEIDRLTDLTVEWLTKIEALRPEPFEVVELEGRPVTGGTEPGTARIALGTSPRIVKLRVRPDRVDRLEDGTLLYIDYKTSRSKPSVSSWSADRPTEPQLLVYCFARRVTPDGSLAEPQPASAVAFAQVAGDSLAFVGLGSRDTIADGIKTVSASRAKAIKELGDWDTARQAWRQTLDQMGTDIHGGFPLPDPRRPDDCSRCDFPALCRYDALPNDSEDDQ